MQRETPPSIPMQSVSDVTLFGLGRVLGKKKAWIIIPSLLAFAASTAVVLIMTPRYAGEARIFLENRENYYARPDKETRSTEAALDPEAVQSQAAILGSRELAMRVIKNLELTKYEEFDKLLKGIHPVKKILIQIGLVKDPLKMSPEERVYDVYVDRVTAMHQAKTRIISVEFSAESPELAQRGANMVADEYIKFQQDAKKQIANNATQWMSQTIDDLRKKVADAEARVEIYRAEKGLLMGSNNAIISTQQLGELNQQLAQARSNQADFQGRARLIREALKSGRLFEVSEINNNELIRKLLENRVTMKAQLALESRTLLEGHPRIKELNSQLHDLENQIRATADRTARALENDARLAASRVSNLSMTLDSQKVTASQSGENEVPLRALEREAKALREQLESLLTKYRDAIARDAENVSQADARIIAYAAPPVLPSFPKKIPIIALATLGTAAIMSGLMLAKHMFALQESASQNVLARAGVTQLPQAPAEMPKETQAPARKSRRLFRLFGFLKPRALFSRKKVEKTAQPLHEPHHIDLERIATKRAPQAVAPVVSKAPIKFSFNQESVKLQEMKQNIALPQASASLHSEAPQSLKMHADVALQEQISEAAPKAIAQSGKKIIDLGVPLSIGARVERARLLEEKEAQAAQLALQPAVQATLHTPILRVSKEDESFSREIADKLFEQAALPPHPYASEPISAPAATSETFVPAAAPTEILATQLVAKQAPPAPAQYIPASIKPIVKQSVAAATDLPALQSEPRLAAPEAPSANIDEGIIGDIFAHISAAQEQKTEEKRNNGLPTGIIITLVGVGRHASTHSAALKLGRSFAQTRPSVLLDLATQTSAEGYHAPLFGRTGLTDYLSEAAEIQYALHRDSVSKLIFLPLGMRGKSGADFDLKSQRGKLLLNSLLANNPFLLIDCDKNLEVALHTLAAVSNYIVVVTDFAEDHPVINELTSELEKRGNVEVMLIVTEALAEETAPLASTVRPSITKDDFHAA